MRGTALSLAGLLLASSVQADSLSSPGYTDAKAQAAAAAAGFVKPDAVGGLPSMDGGRASSTIYSSTASQSISVSGAETSVFSSTYTGPGQIVPANGAYVGNKYRLHAAGNFTTSALAVGVVAVKVKFGSSTIVTGNIPSLTTGLANMPFTIDEVCTVRGVGATGTILCTGGMSIAIALASASIQLTALNNTTPATVDTTTDAKLDITLTPTLTAGTASFNVMEATIEIVN